MVILHFWLVIPYNFKSVIITICTFYKIFMCKVQIFTKFASEHGIRKYFH